MHFKEMNKIHKIPTQGSTVPVGNEACRVSHWNGGPEGWDFPIDTEHQWSIFFLTYYHRIILQRTSHCWQRKISEKKKKKKN